MPATALTLELPLTAAQLPDEPATLKSMFLEVLQTLRQTQHERDALRQQLARLVQRLYGPRTERFDPDQPTLFDQLPAPAAPAPTAAPQPPPAPPGPRRCRPHGRRRLPSDLP